MQIQLTNTGKRYNRDWIFRHCTYTFNVGNSYAIIGPNGSGKSTLLQTIAGAINPSEGSVDFSVDNQPLTVDNFYKQIALVAPYLEVIEEMTATEFLQFHAAFKPLLPNITIAEIIAIIGLEKNANKQIRYYSSGMKQRIKLAQAIFADTNVLLLDEPCTNLDITGYNLYNQLISTYCSHKLIIVSSNDLQEYGFCKAQISIADYK
jgi:ABC-type multidrug transport system ATPase subunit